MEQNGTIPEFIAQLPKTETHLHMEGSLDWNLLHKLDPARFHSPPASHAPHFKFRDFDHFEIELLDMAGAWFTSPERYFEAAQATFQRQISENVRYVETSFASGVIEFADLDGKAILDAILAAVPEGLTVRVFLGIHHNGYTEKMKPILDDAVHWEGLAGFDLHGTETFPLESWSSVLWEKSRKAGKFNKAHAGEFCGPDFVTRVLDELKVNRLQHGVRAIEDAALVSRLAEEGITCDVCPISNYKLAVIDQPQDHPIRRLMDAGVRCTVSTDDPISFGNRLTEEYLFLHRNLDFGKPELLQIARSGFEVALISDAERNAALAELDGLL